MSFSRRCTASTLRAADRPRCLLRPTTSVIPIWLYHGERQGATVGEEGERLSGIGGGNEGLGLGSEEGCLGFHLRHVDMRRKAAE
jgi:hypothetical protein